MVIVSHSGSMWKCNKESTKLSVEIVISYCANENQNSLLLFRLISYRFGGGGGALEPFFSFIVWFASSAPPFAF